MLGIYFQLIGQALGPDAVYERYTPGQVYKGRFELPQERTEFSSCYLASQEDIATRPEYIATRVMVINDRNDSGAIEAEDIQDCIDDAHRRWAAWANLEQSVDTNYFMLVMPVKAGPYLIDETIQLETGVMLNGNGQELRASGSHLGESLIEIKKGAKSVGVFNTILYGTERVESGLVQVKPNCQAVLIYNNSFRNELPHGVRDQDGHVDNLAGVRISKDVNRVYVDNNFFVHVSSGIIVTADNTTNVHLNYNRISEWRVRGIYISAGARGSERIFINNNRINPPKKGPIKQPVAIQRTANSPGASHVHVRNNYIMGSGEPHIKYEPESNRGTADQISLHEVSEFVVMNNCLYNGGESGIMVVRGCQNGKVIKNFISAVDIAAIYVGNRQNDGTVSNIVVRDNLIINPARNRDELARAEWARAGISVDHTDGIKILRNYVEENESVPYSNDPDRYRTSVYGIYVDDTVRGHSTNGNTFDLPEHVISIRLPD